MEEKKTYRKNNEHFGIQDKNRMKSTDYGKRQRLDLRLSIGATARAIKFGSGKSRNRTPLADDQPAGHFEGDGLARFIYGTIQNSSQLRFWIGRH